MKKIAFLLLSTLLFTACGQTYTVADPETIEANPDLAGVIDSWQRLVDAGAEEDCAAILEQMRSSLNLTEEACPAAIEYLKNAPEVDWEKTDWNATGGKAKIYELDGGSITAFLLEESDDTWRADSAFWND